jgi:hypothetical protein
MSDDDTLLDEWNSYYETVLAPRGITPELAALFRIAFYSGASSAIAILGSKAAALGGEIKTVAGATDDADRRPDKMQ